MKRRSTPKRSTPKKTHKVARVAKREQVVSKRRPKGPRAKARASSLPSSKRTGSKSSNKDLKSGTHKASRGAIKSQIRLRIESRKAFAAPVAPPRLLRESRSTSAALSLLEKGIRLIYQKEFRKARTEFSSLLQAYPWEPEILARTRTYLQICDREEAANRRPAIASDQLYTLGVMEHNRGNYDRAISYFRQSIEKNPSADYIYYSMAASLTMKGDVSEAIITLKKAIELNEDNRVYARNDGDFNSLHTRNEFVGLVGMLPASSSELSQI